MRTFLPLLAALTLCTAVCAQTDSIPNYFPNPAGKGYRWYSGGGAIPVRWSSPWQRDSTDERQEFAFALLEGRFRGDLLNHPTWSTGPAVEGRVTFAFLFVLGARAGWSVGYNDNSHAERPWGLRLQGGMDATFLPQAAEARNRWVPAAYWETSLVINPLDGGSWYVAYTQGYPFGNEVVRTHQVAIGCMWPIGEPFTAAAPVER